VPYVSEQIINTMSFSTSKIGKRKRPREEVEDRSSGRVKSHSNAQIYDDKKTSIDGPLHGVIVCLSGLAQYRKDDLHQLILSLGGRYTRELNLDKNTHLITETAKGAKYGLAVSSNPLVIHIVTPSWLIATSEIGQRARETDHRLESTKNNSKENRTHTTYFAKRPLISIVNDALCENPVTKVDNDRGGDVNLSCSFVFEKLQFYLIGFEGNPVLKQKMSKLIRRGNGMINWDMDEDLSILLLCDTSNDALQKAARVITTHHSNFPSMVSPLWVIESYKHSALQSILAYPSAGEEHLDSNYSNDRIKSTKKGATFLSRTSLLSSTTSNVSIFRGCLFSLVRSSTLIECDQPKPKFVTSANVEFDPNELEALIKAHGGQTLSSKLLDALRADEENTVGLTKRKCHVVCWGESPPRLETNPLVSQLERHNLCEITFVTPIWVQACVSVRKRIRPERMPLVLMPQLWPMKSALNVIYQPKQFGGNRKEKTDLTSNYRHRYHRLEISLTGFQGTEKSVIVHLIDAIGGVYHDNMSNVNTHLVFKKNPTGLKLEKAIEWGLNVVSIHWLYHILKYGYGGVHKDELCCEKRFSFGVGS